MWAGKVWVGGCAVCRCHVGLSMLRNVNDVLMAPNPTPPPKAEWEMVVCWAVCYVRRLVRSPFPNDPLVGNLYAGQAVRPVGKKYSTAQKLAEKRWQEEDTGAKRGDGSDLCFLEALRVYGLEAFDNEVVWQTKGPRCEVQQLANEKEVVLVQGNGGVVRNLDPDAHIKQTFNRQKGGKALKFSYDGLVGAWQAKRWHMFQAAMLEFVRESKTAVVDSKYVNGDGYRLGRTVSHIRADGIFVDGFPERRAWLNALPRWYWNVQDAPDHAVKRSQIGLENAKKMSQTTKDEKSRKIKATKAARTEGQKSCTIGKMNRTTKKSLCNELIEARKIAIPFVKSAKKRAEMRQVSTLVGGPNSKKLLYMISKDGLTIHRVDAQGSMNGRAIVGPVVDPAPDGAYDSDSD